MAVTAFPFSTFPFFSFVFREVIPGWGGILFLRTML
jgi:hypothetical protein